MARVYFNGSSTMIKKVASNELIVGMFVHDINASWISHPFLKRQFAITSAIDLEKIKRAGIRSVIIDTKKGLDIVQAVEMSDSPKSKKEDTKKKSKKTSRSIDGELQGAKKLFKEATSVIRNLMEDARSGKKLKAATLEPVAERIVQTVLRNHHALTGISRIKTKDEYTFMHCISVAGLLVSFAKQKGYTDEQCQKLAVGGMIHDIGKTLIPDSILNKPAKLSDDEFKVMKHHISIGQAILEKIPDLDKLSVDVITMHHERMDGSGYPFGLKGAQISEVGRMAAIVDVYDALTSVRCYKEAWEPTQALKKLLEWSPARYDKKLVGEFVRCLGIYPVGSLVQLRSGRIGIVMKAGKDLLKPQVRIVYNAKHAHYEMPRDIDLARTQTEEIQSAAVPAKYQLDVSEFF